MQVAPRPSPLEPLPEHPYELELASPATLYCHLISALDFGLYGE